MGRGGKAGGDFFNPLISFQLKASEKTEESSNKVSQPNESDFGLTGRPVTLNKGSPSSHSLLFQKKKKIHPRDLADLFKK